MREHEAGKLSGGGSAHIWVVFVLGAAGELAADEGWRACFDAMVAYARMKEWIATDGGIIAHVVRHLP